MELLKSFTNDEIWKAVKSVAPPKARGKDGFPALFYKRYWHIVGPQICRYCLSIVHGLSELEEINNTRIVLIPKIDKLKNITHYRPISLCNVIYKIVVKVIIE